MALGALVADRDVASGACALTGVAEEIQRLATCTVALHSRTRRAVATARLCESTNIYIPDWRRSQTLSIEKDKSQITLLTIGLIDAIVAVHIQ